MQTEMNEKQQIRKENLGSVIRTVLGLFITATGEYLSVSADIGLAPWDCLSMAISYHTSWSFGTSCVMSGMVILIIDIFIKEPIGVGMVLDVLLVGKFMDMFEAMGLILDIRSTPAGILLMLIGMLLMGIGQYVYISSGQGCGPRDAMLVGIGKRLHWLPIGLVQIIVLGMVVLVSYLLGGPIGIGTLISIVGVGSMMQLVFHVVHFEPRDVVHKNIFEFVKSWK